MRRFNLRNLERCLLLACILLISPTLIQSDDNVCVPAQIRLSLGDLYSSISHLDDLRLASEKLNDNQAYIVWQSKSSCEFTIQLADVETPEKLTTIPVAFQTPYSHTFKHENNPVEYNSTAYTALLHGLKYQHQYQYSIADSASKQLAGPFKFVLSTPNITESPKRIFIAGDTDNTENGNITLDKIRSEFKKNPNSYAAWLHLGDVAYDIQDDNAEKGDDFFNSIQDITGALPFMMTPGNHDKFDHWNLINFRLRNPLYNTTRNQYFSFNLEGIHFVAINTDYYRDGDTETQEKMFDWIKKDLQQANDKEHRALWPWIVVVTHKPIYCVYNDPDGPEDKKCYNYYKDLSIWDEIFHTYSVDLAIAGHLHSYERLKPLYKNETATFSLDEDDIDEDSIVNPKATIYIVEGTGGNNGYAPDGYEANGYAILVNKDLGYGTLHTGKSPSGDRMLTYEHYSSETGDLLDYMDLIKRDVPEAPSDNNNNNNNGGSHVVIIIVGIAACIGLIAGILFLKKWKFGKIAEDKIPLNSSPLRSSRLRYNRPGERGVSMVDL